MKSFVYRSIMAALLLSAALPLQAGEGKANISLVSDYIFRGVSVSGGSTVLQGGYEYDYGNSIVVGVWSSTLPDKSEYDIYAHYSDEFGNFGYSTGFIYYSYTGPADLPAEFNLALSYYGFSIMNSSGEAGSYNEVAYQTEVKKLGIRLHYGSDGSNPDRSIQLLKKTGGMEVALVFASKLDSITSISTEAFALTLSKDF